MLYEGRRYPPKAVIGIAAEKLTGAVYGPYDFTGGLGSKCFRILKANGFTIVTKSETSPFPDEVEESPGYSEGAVQRVFVNRYERDPKARVAAIRHHGAHCQVCRFDFRAMYGALGEGFIHVHHTVPLSTINGQYAVDPVKDLKPVCPNCHAMLHKKEPPYTVEELREVMQGARRG